MCFSTARSERPSAAATEALLRPWAISARTSLSRGVRNCSGRVGPAGAGVDQRLTTLGSITDPPAATSRTARDELVDVGHALLQEVGAPLGSAVEQLERVAGLDVLAEHDDAELGMRLAQLRGGAHTFVGAGRGHADVGEHDVGRARSRPSAMRPSKSSHTPATSMSGSASSRRVTASRTR